MSESENDYESENESENESESESENESENKLNCLNDDKIYKGFIDSVDGSYDEKRYIKLNKDNQKYEYLVRKKIYELNENNIKYISFNGCNCNVYRNANCHGWNGIDRRCECKGRRVYWKDSVDDDDNDYIYADAD